jgi:BirA family biotin operon repressor/biotin-[acetyl-CoA-carboxylase] ligase
MNALDVELLRTLRGSSLHLPGAELAGRLKTPLGTVEQRLAGLREAGFEIEQHPGLGYRLLVAPDRLIADDLTARLGECGLVREIMVFEETDSTNERAAQLGRAGVAGGVAIFSERQTAGRGRFGRRWESAGHRGLWFSLLLRPALAVEHWARLTTWAATGVAAAVEGETGAGVQIKWPNDIFVAGRKVAGILTETVFESGREPFAIVGIGVNVNHEPGDFPAELVGKAGSLRIAGGRVLDRAALAVAILRGLDSRQAALVEDFAQLVQETAQRSALLGLAIQVRAGHTLLEGIAEGLDSEGQLFLREANGTVRTLTAGEVSIIPVTS